MSGEITLTKMSQAEYNVWHVKSKDTYRDEIIKNGMTLSEAQKKADDDMFKLLPDGLNSLDQHIFSIKEDGKNWIGTIWFGVRGAEDNRKAFIFDIVLEVDTRGKGYGKKAMLLIEDELKKLNLKHIGLHVFGHNSVARNLYEKLGYGITNLNMEKTL